MLQDKDILEIRKDFKYLDVKQNGRSIIYLDNAATTQKPLKIVDAISKYYNEFNGNPHRGAHYLSVKSTEVYDEAREKVREFIGAKSVNEIVFLRNTTEAFNLLAYSYALEQLNKDDEILISIMEHHSNCVNWQFVAKKTGAKLKYVYLDEDKNLDIEDFKSKVSEKTKIVSITAASNVVGTMPNIEELIKIVREKSDAKFIVDAAQYVPHNTIDVKKWDADFVAFSGHKMLAAMGIGVLYGKEELLNEMTPFMYGGDMIEYVYEDKATFLKSPQRFEAGTTNVGGAYSLLKAIEYYEEIGIDNIRAYEEELTNYCYDKMKKLDYIEIYTTENKKRSPLVCFNFKEVHPHDVASILDNYGISIRSGHHCAQPLHRYLGSNFSCRASFAFYNTKEEVDYFIEHLEEVRRLMKVGS